MDTDLFYDYHIILGGWASIYSISLVAILVCSCSNQLSNWEKCTYSSEAYHVSAVADAAFFSCSVRKCFKHCLAVQKLCRLIQSSKWQEWISDHQQLALLSAGPTTRQFFISNSIKESAVDNKNASVSPDQALTFFPISWTSTHQPPKRGFTWIYLIKFYQTSANHGTFHMEVSIVMGVPI